MPNGPWCPSAGQEYMDAQTSPRRATRSISPNEPGFTPRIVLQRLACPLLHRPAEVSGADLP